MLQTMWPYWEDASVIGSLDTIIYEICLQQCQDDLKISFSFVDDANDLLGYFYR